jgi:hypothetical protein
VLRGSIGFTQAAHEFGGVFRIAEFLERMGERCDPSFFILLAGRSRIAFDRLNHLSGDRAALEVDSRQAETCDVSRRIIERRSIILRQENAAIRTMSGLDSSRHVLFSFYANVSFVRACASLGHAHFFIHSKNLRLTLSTGWRNLWLEAYRRRFIHLFS